MHYKFVLTPNLGFMLPIILLFSGEMLGAKELAFNSKQVQINDETYFLEIAKSREQRLHGLMFRRDLDSRNGMLFIYPKSAKHQIWMKNTLIELNVLWIDETGKVLDIQRLEPCQLNPCVSYGINKPSKYIIELNGLTHNIEVGDEIMGLDQF